MLLSGPAQALTQTSAVAAAQSSADLWALSQRLRPSTPLHPALAAVPLVTTVGSFASARALCFVPERRAGRRRGGGAFADGVALVALATLTSADALFYLGITPDRRLAHVAHVVYVRLVPFAFRRGVCARGRGGATRSPARSRARSSRRAVAVAAAVAAAAAAPADDARGDACDRSTSLCAARAMSS